MTKICSKCGIEKELNEFPKRKISKDGHRNQCKNCRKPKDVNYFKKYKIKNKEKIKVERKIYNLKNRDKRIKWNSENKEYIKKRDKKYTEKNRKIISKKKKIYFKNNKAKITEYKKNRYLSDPEYNIIEKIRKRIRSTLKRQEASKKYRTIELLGCDFKYYKEYIEALFTKDMTWEKLRTGKIHIDHIKPCASFDLREPEQQKQCFHYNNTQPLWAIDNMFKGAKY